ncbi:MAG: vanadium-dependent haloperoxidase [Gemmatimonadaceae bacterium]
MHASTLLRAVFAVALVACGDTTVPTETSQSAAANAENSAQNNAVVYWNAVARGLVIKFSSGAPAAIRGYALVSIAQHNAAAAVADRGVHAAISAASVVTLSSLYPTEQSALELQLQQYLTSTSPNDDPNEGESIGRNEGARVVAYAQTDRFFAPWTGTVPTGPGIWFSSTPPVGPMFGQAKTLYLLAGNQFRPPPHPAFGSVAFQDALAEVRHFSDTRTPEQDSIAKFWNLPAGTHQPPGYWNEEGARLVIKYRVNARRAAQLFALMNAVSYDGIVASHEAKYTYWLLRPTMADPAITLSIGLPNFPAYPSNHAAISAGMAAILGGDFPAEKLRLARLADQAALSRVFGGIHYRFDGTAGLTLGRRIAEWARAHAVALRQPYPLQ